MIRLPQRLLTWILSAATCACDAMAPASLVGRAELAAEPADGVWASRRDCERLVSQRRAKRKPGVARIMTYNVRWFPDGRPGKKPARSGTDLGWLACAIAASNSDVVLLQELKAHPRGRSALQKLAGELNRLTNGSWQAKLDGCPRNATLHNGFLYDGARVTGRHFATYASLNPHREACKHQLRPGFGAYFELSGGLDLHVINVHLKSGARRRSYDLRRKTLQGLKQAISEARALTPDRDVILAGDFNAMGCRHCKPPISAEAERRTLATELGRAGLKLARNSPSCSHYYRGQGGLLDFVAHDPGQKEVPRSLARVTGYCEDLACQPTLPDCMPAAYERLSDHCPVVLELKNEDLD